MPSGVPVAVTQSTNYQPRFRLSGAANFGTITSDREPMVVQMAVGVLF
jgi:hypothetical protein